MILRPEDEHGPVFCPATLELGEIHWYLLRAATLTLAKTEVRTKVEGTSGLTTVRAATTDFAMEVGRDEIDW